MSGEAPTGSADHTRLRESLGAYLLGGLDADQEREVRLHLPGCVTCRSELVALQEVVGALAAVDPADPSPGVPAGLDARVEQTLRGLAAEGAHVAPAAPTADAGPTPPVAPRRTLRRAPVLAVAATAALLGAAAAAAVAVALDDDAPPAPVVAAEPVDLDIVDRSIEASAELVDHTWGMEIEIVGTGFTAGRSYDVSVTDASGRTYSSGAFVGVGPDRITCEMNSAVLRADAVGFEVVDRDGEPVLTADLEG